MAPSRPLPPHDPNQSSEPISTDDAKESTQQPLLDKSKKEKVSQLLPLRSGLNLKSVLKIVLALVFSLSYLTFCWIVYYRTVPISGGGVLSLSFVHFTTESGITTVAILITYVALWPIKGVIDEIRSEEFFRLLHNHPKGVPLDSINAISAPTTGAFDIFLATFHRRCSRHLSSTLGITLMIAVVSAIAPAALNAVSIGIEVYDPTFQIGSIPESFFVVDFRNGTASWTPQLTFPLAASLSWVESKLNLTNAYSGVASDDTHDSFGYVIPFPPSYTTVMQAHWTTDIIVLEPSCSWQTTSLSTTGVVNANLTRNGGLLITLPEANLNFSLSSDYFVPALPTGEGSLTAKASVATPPYYNANSTTRIISSDGSVVFVISQLNYTKAMSLLEELNRGTDQLPSANLSNIPTLQFSNKNLLGILLCSPHASIQTRQVRTTGNGIFTLGKQQPSVGNLDPDQTNYVLSFVLSYLATCSGPLDVDVGTDMMIRLIFGDKFQAFLNTPPAPLTNITAVYKQAVQSAMKSLVSGAFATTNVTGGYVKPQVAFRSSLGHVIISTVLFSLLTVVLVAAHFRKERDGFTFVNVAAELADSDAPKKCVEIKESVSAGEGKILIRVANGGQNCIQVFD